MKRLRVGGEKSSYQCELTNCIPNRFFLFGRNLPISKTVKFHIWLKDITGKKQFRSHQYKTLKSDAPQTNIKKARCHWKKGEKNHIKPAVISKWFSLLYSNKKKINSVNKKIHIIFFSLIAGSIDTKAIGVFWREISNTGIGSNATLPFQLPARCFVFKGVTFKY